MLLCSSEYVYEKNIWYKSDVSKRDYAGIALWCIWKVTVYTHG